MSSIKFYRRKSKNTKIGSMGCQPPQGQYYWIPETPAKLTQARPQKIIHARIDEEEKDKESQTKAPSFLFSDGLIDLNKSICDWEDTRIAACGSKDSGDSANCFLETALLAEQETKESRDSEEGEVDFILGDTKSSNNNVARILDFCSSGESNKGSLNCCPSVAPPAFPQSEIASQESPGAQLKDEIGRRKFPPSQISGSGIDRKIPESEGENLLPGNQNPMLSLAMENGISNSECDATQCDKQNEKGGGLEPATPMLDVKKRQRKETDVNQSPLKRTKIKKHRHRPKIAGQGRSKKHFKISLEGNKPKRKNVRKNQEKKEKGSFLRKTEYKKSSIQQTFTAEHHTEIVAAKVSSLSGVKYQNDERIIEIMQPEADDHSNDDKPIDVNHGSKSVMESNLGSFGGKELLNDLRVDINSIRWSSYGIRSARDYCRNSFSRKKIGFQNGCLWVSQMSLKVNHCLSNSRRFQPNFPRSCRRRRTKRKRKSVVCIILGSFCLSGCIKKKRSKRFLPRRNLWKQFIQRVNLSPLDMVQMINDKMLNIHTCESQKLASDKGKEQVNHKRNVPGSSVEMGQLLQQPLAEMKGAEPNSVAKPHENLLSKCNGQALTKQDHDDLQRNHEKKVIGQPADQKLQLTVKSKGQVSNRKGRTMTVEQIIDKFKKLNISDITAIVPHKGSESTKKPKPMVLLDSVTIKRWNKLMKIDDGPDDEKVEGEDHKKWEEERKIFRGRVEAFNSIMHTVLGDRSFRPWKGSVVDSVVGVFLTQNVSDFLSSSAYMSLAAKFPAKSPTNDQETVADGLENNNSQSSTRSNICFTEATQDEDGNQYFITEPVDMTEEMSLVDIEDLGNTVLPWAQSSSRSPSEILEVHENVVYENISEEKNWMKGDQHAQNEVNETNMKILHLVTRIRYALKAVADKTKKTGGLKKEKFKEVEKRDWDELRKMYSRPITSEHTDTVNWEAVKEAPVTEIAEIIKGRGQHTIIAKRIQDFLKRLLDYHGSIDLEWLRYAPSDLVKAYLLEIPGLGLKSVECVRLLALEDKAFPVDVNVARILVRLGWIPLEPLPGNLQFHLLEEYPIMDSIQKYLWPRLAELDQRTLYELHYHMITVGKVVCTKKNPNCRACPMKAECRHFASAVASANMLPGPSRKDEERSIVPLGNYASVGNCDLVTLRSTSLLESNKTLASELRSQNCEPIIEEPKSPQLEQVTDDLTIEEIIYDDKEAKIPTIKLNNESFKKNVHYFMDKYGQNLQSLHLSRDIVPVYVDVDSVPLHKLKHTNRLRTEHRVYEIPDNHELLRGVQKRDPDDPLPYLLAIWTAGETPESCEPPKQKCNSQGIELCNDQTCSSCQTILEARADIVRGTILIPCRTAMRGRFPLNGTYFQVNEVFAEHQSSYNPIIVHRSSIWHLKRRTVYIGTSPTSIFKGTSSIREIQENFWRGFICVRGWDSKTGEPKPLSKRFHCPPSKMEKTGRRTHQSAGNRK
ncbi:DEMETER-like protein 2 isoform X2 [Manihot esculenta]|uniref:DEMETER-like protein 2 isoform X2 n=1 Tax=Manihot esculenta TaxID=3983 RepID=UPI000B5D47E0|nr:DEMETER-like protein 2 isoform X2 [Manihot esculenta]